MISLAVLLTAPAAPPSKAVTIPVLRAHVHDWNGRQVTVRGWMHGCKQSCFLGPSAAWHQGRERLTLTADGPMRRTLDGLSGRRVVVRGTVDEFRCAPDNICLDGADTLRVATVDVVAGLRR